VRQHHKDAIVKMTEHFYGDPNILGLFLIGSVATDTARPDSDIDAVAILTPDVYEEKKKTTGTLEVIHGKCTYEGGYFDIHYHTRDQLIEFAENGSEPVRNMFDRAVPLFYREADLPELAAKIPVFPKGTAAERQLRFYCTLKQYFGYFWNACKPQGYTRHHVADGMVFNLYRLILIENEILFPSMRKLEEYVINAPNKPEGIVGLCHAFMRSLSDEDCRAIVEAYEAWTKYDYPKDWHVIMNSFSDPWEWQ
jgi:predicted nucleotidyltransferase